MYQNYIHFSYLPHSPPFSHSSNILIKNKSLPNILSSQFNSNINIINKQLSNIQTSPPTPSSTQIPFSVELHNDHIHYCISKYHFEITSTSSSDNEKQTLKEKNKFLLNQIKKLEKKLNESKLINENKEMKLTIKQYENELYAIKIQCEEILNENNELKNKMKYIKEELFNEITNNKTKRKLYIINTTQFEIINNDESNYDTINNNNIETENENENSNINTHTNKCNDSQDLTFSNSINNNHNNHYHNNSYF